MNYTVILAIITESLLAKKIVSRKSGLSSALFSEDSFGEGGYKAGLLQSEAFYFFIANSGN